ncbi:MAG: uroporphyrinogen-III C-methyltransferase [Synergistales bacterium]|nr:uroporphyrinogen-III C-methyltransferase [Synergistales bacterium]
MTVHLVGAGCGTPAHLTFAAGNLLNRADHVVYDRLIHPDLLQLCPVGCSFHPVGKRRGDHYLSQKEINTLLVRLGREGGTVVRLKGGDPFLFGRGGEEALALQEADLAWEALPGLSAALVGGAMGVTPTHRGLARSLTLATGQTEDGSLDGPFWSALAAVPGTLALYMGVSLFPKIASLLEEGGIPPETPAAAVTWAGWGRARIRRGTLADLAEAARGGDVKSPSILYLGAVTDLPLKPARKALQGMQVACCRPAPESWETARLLESFGADAYSLPLLKPESLVPPEAAERIAKADWIVLTSPRSCPLLTDLAGDLRRVKARLAVIGDGTARALKREGLVADAVASPETSEGLARLLAEELGEGERVLFFRNERGSRLPVEAARSREAVVDELAAYRMITSLLPAEELYREHWSEVPLDAVVFGSAALAESWLDRFGPLPEGCRAVAWGPHCGVAVRELFGVDPLVMERPESRSLVKTLKEVWPHV